MVPEALRRLRALIADLMNDLLPDDEGDPQVRAAYRASVIGVLLAGLHATYTKNCTGTVAAIRMCEQATTEEHPDVLIELDRMRSVAPGDMARHADVQPNMVQRGVQAAIDGLRTLPDLDETGKVAFSQQIGGMIGFLQGMVELGGFDTTVFDAIEMSKRAAKQIQDVKQQAYLDVQQPITDPNKAN